MDEQAFVQAVFHLQVDWSFQGLIGPSRTHFLGMVRVPMSQLPYGQFRVPEGLFFAVRLDGRPEFSSPC